MSMPARQTKNKECKRVREGIKRSNAQSVVEGIGRTSIRAGKIDKATESLKID